MSVTTTIPLAGDLAADHARRVCRHCGAPSPQGEFCCPGCNYVFRLIHEQGLAAYYQIKDDVTAPADPALFQPRDHAWLATAQRQAEAGALAGPRTPELTLGVQGVSCAGCVWLIEKLFHQQSGAGRIEVNAQTGQMRMRWARGEFDAPAFARVLQNFNYLVGPAGADGAAELESRALVRRIGLCTAFAMNVMLFTLPAYFGMRRTDAYAQLFGTLSMGFATLSLLAGGGYFLGRAARALRARVAHLDLPIALGIVGAYAGSFYGWIAGREEFLYFDFVSAFILLMLVGRWAQIVAVERNQRRLLRQQPAPPSVCVLAADGTTTSTTPENLRSGQRFEVSMGQTVPVEAKLENAAATFSLAWINGEAEPRVFHPGQHVPSGAQNIGRTAVRLVAAQDWSDSLLATLLRPVERAAGRDQLVERVIQGYLVAIVGIAFFAGVSWLLTMHDALRAGAVVTAVLVVSCPCALGLAFPLVDEIATVALRRRGVFVRDAGLWSRLSRVRRLVFDKTGTLTLETPVLQNPTTLTDLDAETRTALLTLVQDCPHPVSLCLHESLLAGGPIAPHLMTPPVLAGEIRETIGLGVELGAWSLGQAGWRDAGPADGTTVLAHGGAVRARFNFVDTARADAKPELAALSARGLDVAMLSGDRPDKVAALAQALGLDLRAARGGLSPQAKAAWLDAHSADETLMLGDGANDSLAFDRALCRGTPVVHRGLLAAKADFYYLGRGIGGLRALFEINDARRRTRCQLLVFMIAYNLLAVGLSVAGVMHPLLAAVLMPLSSLATLALTGWGMRGVSQTVNRASSVPALGAFLSGADS